VTRHPLLLASFSTLLALSASGCGNQSTTAPTTTTSTTSTTAATTATTTTTTTASSGSTEFFVGDLAPKGAGFYSFTVTNAGTVAITLVSVNRGGLPAQAALGLGFGVPSGAGCATTISLSTGAALAAQIATSAGAGIYCVELHDQGTLTSSVSFVVRIVHT
jgi:hypothetical protein